MENLKLKRGRPKKSSNAELETFKNDYLDVRQVSQMLKLSVSHVYTLTSQQRIPHIKLLGKKLLFSKSEIENWLKSKSVPHK
jgi:excisionase family DNA binding protein